MDRFSEKVEITQEKLSRQQIEEYISLVKSAFSEDHGIVINAEYASMKIAASSIEELASNPRVPDFLRELVIHIWEPRTYHNVHQIQKAVYFSLSSLWLTVTVEGFDETWVLGVKERLQRFFDQDRPRQDRLKPLLINKLTHSIIIGIWVVLIYYMLSLATLIESFLFAIASSYLVITYNTWVTWPSGRDYRVIIRKGKREILGMSSKEYIPIIISLLTLLVTGAQLIISLAKQP